MLSVATDNGGGFMLKSSSESESDIVSDDGRQSSLWAWLDPQVLGRWEGLATSCLF